MLSIRNSAVLVTSKQVVSSYLKEPASGLHHNGRVDLLDVYRYFLRCCVNAWCAGGHGVIYWM